MGKSQTNRAAAAAARELAATVTSWATSAPPVGTARYGSLYGLLLDVGESFTPAPRPADVVAGAMGFCYANAVTAASLPGWAYVEGLALLDTGGTRLPVPHAWVTTDGHTAVDVTWPDGKGVAYLGVRLAPAAWAGRPFWDSSPVLDVHARPTLLTHGVPGDWLMP
ncbi:hypothetical protein AB0D67_37810 [Streptosporangium sp. NPDC048047]|uniref:hypothetical protein n=1 Tax=Streptosporangium sp. NPDC048047 TaxID=3155748 RepID=UPI003418F414